MFFSISHLFAGCQSPKRRTWGKLQICVQTPVDPAVERAARAEAERRRRAVVVAANEGIPDCRVLNVVRMSMKWCVCVCVRPCR